MCAPIINLEMDFRRDGVFYCGLGDPGVKSFGLGWDWELGWVCRSVGPGTHVGGEEDNGGEETHVYMISSLKTSWSPAIKNSGGSPPKYAPQ